MSWNNIHSFSWFFSKWKTSTRLRHTVILSGLILFIMGLISTIMLAEQRTTLYETAEAKSMAFTQSFAMAGWAAIHSNLFRIQEALMEYSKDPDIRGIEVIDNDNMIVAAQIPERIGLVLDDQEWLDMKQMNREVLQYTEGPTGELILIIVTPLSKKEKIEAWIRVIFSLEDLRREEAQLVLRMTIMTIILMAIGILGVRWSQKQMSFILQKVINQLQETLAKLKVPVFNPAKTEFRKARDPNRRKWDKGDVEHLGEAVTETIGLLKVQSEALHDSTMLLEQKVKDRTIDLLDSKQSLEKEIIERRSAQDKLEKFSRQYQLILNSVGEGIYGLDLNGNCTFVNPAAAHMLGYRPAELIRGSMHTIVHHTKANGLPYPREDCLICNTFQDGTVCRIEDDILWRKDGTSFPAEYTSTPIRDDKGKLIGAVVVFQDISDRKRAETIVRQSEKRIRQSQKMEAMGTLAGGIAHDFNNILMAILGYCQLAQLNIAQGSGAHRYLNEVLIGGQRAKELVEQILTFSRQSEQERKPVRFCSIIEEVLRLMRATLPSTIVVSQDLENGDGTILADHTQMHQVLMNLCANAEYAMRGKHGTLTVKLVGLHISTDFTLKHSELTPGPHLHLTVEDTGPGISPDILPRIFDPFFTTKNVGEGTGMGLSVVHGIISSHGGIITVDSHIGQGTKFEIFVPQIESLPKLNPKEADSQEFSGIGRILFVDDEKSLSQLGEELLEYLGYEVTACTSGLEALKIFQADPYRFDAVITDQTMPNMTGEMLAKEILRNQPDFPVILCTGFSYTVTPERAKQLGIRRYLMKPLVIQDLASALQEELKNQRTKR